VIVMKAWWQKNRWFVIFGLAIGLAIFFGWRFWEGKIVNERLAASMGYQGILENLADNDYESAAENARIQIGTQPVMPYELMSQLLLARIEVQEQKFDQAIKNLQWVINQSEDDSYFYELASVRLARVYLTQGKPEEALKVLDSAEDKKYPDWFVAKADVSAALKRYDDARTNFNKALALYPPFGFQRQMLTMQIADLPE
jgi:predicted negative regulator of RcsB-dependent stress response